jgi:hypothetical protein
MKKAEERGGVMLQPLASKFAFEFSSNVVSQFPASDYQGNEPFQSSPARYAVLFPTSYAMFYMLRERDVLAYFGCLDSGLGVV